MSINNPIFTKQLIIDRDKLSAIEINPDNAHEVNILLDGQVFNLDTEDSARILLCLYPASYTDGKLPEKFVVIISKLGSSKIADELENSY